VQNYYPERLGKALMIHVPYIFMKAWKMIYPFIDTNTRDKVTYRTPMSMISDPNPSCWVHCMLWEMRKC